MLHGIHLLADAYTYHNWIAAHFKGRNERQSTRRRQRGSERARIASVQNCCNVAVLKTFKTRSLKIKCNSFAVDARVVVGSCLQHIDQIVFVIHFFFFWLLSVFFFVFWFHSFDSCAPIRYYCIRYCLLVSIVNSKNGIIIVFLFRCFSIPHHHLYCSKTCCCCVLMLCYPFQVELNLPEHIHATKKTCVNFLLCILTEHGSSTRFFCCFSKEERFRVN